MYGCDHHSCWWRPAGGGGGVKLLLRKFDAQRARLYSCGWSCGCAVLLRGAAGWPTLCCARGHGPSSKATQPASASSSLSSDTAARSWTCFSPPPLFSVRSSPSATDTWVPSCSVSSVCVRGCLARCMVCSPANADFYLIAEPTLFWQGFPRLARQSTYMVTAGLVIGNTLKDLAGFHRPPSPPVWRPVRILRRQLNRCAVHL